MGRYCHKQHQPENYPKDNFRVTPYDILRKYPINFSKHTLKSVFGLIKKRITNLSLSMLLLLMILTLNPLGYAESISAELLLKSPHAISSDLVVYAEALIKGIHTKEKVTFIDVRQPAEFKALHIKGAINIPPYFIKKKPYLKRLPIVLVDQGLAFHRLSPYCRELKEKGFNVRILDGGMAAWSSYNGPMVGEPVNQMNYHYISAADVFFEKNFDQRIVLDVSAKRFSDMERLMPFAVHLPLTGSPKDWIVRLNKLKAIRIKHNFAGIIVVDKDVRKYNRLHDAFNQTGFKNVFFLKGGVDAYKDYLKGLTLLRQPYKKRTVGLNKCKNCRDRKESK
jgi:rhodanese-related sulfurtransferase